MQHRSPARFLAPLALIAAFVAVYVVVQPQPDSAPAPASTSSVVKSTQPTKEPVVKRTSKTYTVKSGDTLSGIAEQTGVPLEQILSLNQVDANSLRVGRKLTLRR
jgi:LysM repeat protein